MDTLLQKKSIYGTVSNLQERFPTVTVLTNETVKKLTMKVVLSSRTPLGANAIL